MPGTREVLSTFDEQAMDGQTDEKMDIGWMDRLVDRWIDRKTVR